MKVVRDKELARQKAELERSGVSSREADRAATRVVDQATELAERQRRS